MDLNKDLNTELGTLLDRANRAWIRMGDTITEWRQINAAWRKTLAITVVIREEARQIRQQARLSVARSKERREAILSGLPAMQPRHLPAAADD